VASQDYRNDIVVSEERIAKVAETYRGIRNTLRYQLSNLYDFDPAKHTVAADKLTGLDRWILNKLASVEARVEQRYSDYEFHMAYQILSQFVSVELSAFYHDVIKDRLYTLAANHPKRRSSQTALHKLISKLALMVAPMIPFTAEEAVEYIPSRESSESVLLSEWVTSEYDAKISDWEQMIPLRLLILPKLEKARQSKAIGKSLDAKVVVKGKKVESMVIAKQFQEDFRELLNVSQVEIDFVDVPPGSGSFLKEIIIAHADGQKCERCWHWETDVGKNSEHPTICDRCVEAVVQSEM